MDATNNQVRVSMAVLATLTAPVIMALFATSQTSAKILHAHLTVDGESAEKNLFAIPPVAHALIQLHSAIFTANVLPMRFAPT